MQDLFHRPGFLGTSANFIADVTLIISLVILAIFSIGFALARSGRYVAHGRLQTLGTVVNLILVLWLMILPFRDFVVRDLQGPRPTIFYVVTSIHGLIGFVTLTFGIYVVLRGHNLVPKALRFQNYKPFMRAAYALYFTATLVGVLVYLTWFVFIPNPPLFT